MNVDVTNSILVLLSKNNRMNSKFALLIALILFSSSCTPQKIPTINIKKALLSDKRIKKYKRRALKNRSSPLSLPLEI